MYINIVVQIYSWFKLYSLLFLRILMYDNEFETNNNYDVIKTLNQRKNWTTRYTLNSVTWLVHSLKTCFCFKHWLESEAMPEHLICFHQGVWHTVCRNHDVSMKHLQFILSWFNPLTSWVFLEYCFSFDIHTLNNISKVPFEFKVPIIVYI